METRITCYNFRRYIISKRSNLEPFIMERDMAGSIFNTQLISLFLLGLGISGAITLVVATGLVIRHYSDSTVQSFNWRLRNWRLKQLSAIACLFFLAMAASYWVIQEAWGWIYLLVAFKTGLWWLRRATSREI
jgi:hypothetical protein